MLILFCFLFAVSCLDDIARVDPEALKKLVDEGKIVLVDARWEQEYREGHLPSAINIQPFQFSHIEDFLPKDKGKTIIFYCGGRG
jgi:rhodanese-related sulfurtransferase